MNAERLKQIEEIYHAVLEISPGKRDSFLNEFCGADENLRREVESLLTFEKAFDEFIDTSPASLAAEMFAEQAKQLKLVDREIGHYKIKKLLGAGGMGEVYLAEDIKLNRQVALKFLSVPIRGNQNLLRRFEQEAFAASALNHPNIVTIYEFEAEGEVCFLAVEYIEGETLRETLSRDKLTLKETLSIAKQTALALSAAHRAGIIHRDIKPENIMQRKDGIVKVLDFGLAKLLEQPTVLAGESKSNNSDAEPKIRVLMKTNPGAVMGTAVYMSPEQARGKEVDERTDVWSLGVCLYEMLSGRQPFTGETTSDTIVSILTKEPQPLDDNLPAEIQHIIRKTLQKDPDKRYQTAKNLLIDLEDVEEELKFQSKLERTGAPSREESKTQILSATTTDAAYTTSSAEYIVSEIKRYKSSVFVTLSILLLAAISLGYWLYEHRPLNANSIESIAVLPFQNESENTDIEYLADGVSESLINSLSQLPNMKVIARSSSFRYKGKAVDLQQVAKDLNVQAVMTGRVVKRGDMLDVSVNLTDTQNNTQLWGQHYTQKLSNVFAVQDDIARQVADSLRMKLTGAEQKKLTKRYTDNEEAYKLYLQGRYQWNKRTGESLKMAEKFYKQAIEKDPNFALAYASLAETYSLFTKYSVSSQQDAMSQVKETAMRALELDDSLAEAHNALAFYLHAHAWNQPASEREFRRAIELNPNYATAHHWLSQGPLIVTQKFDEALAEARRAEELDPLSTVIRTDTGMVLYWMKRFDEAIAQYKHTIAIDPNFYYARWSLGAAYHQKGMYTESIAEYKKALQLEDDPWVIGLLACSLAKTGQRNAALKLIEQLKVKSSRRYVANYSIAIAYAALGDKDQAFFWLEKDFAEHSSSAPNYFQDFFLDDLRGDQRFKDLIDRVGLIP